MRRRRKFRGTWVPTLFDELQEDEGQFCTIVSLGTAAPQDGTVAVGLAPVAVDNLDDNTGRANLLNDAMQGGWALRRVVGKIFCSLQSADTEYGPPTALNTYPTGVAVTVGLFVARAQQDQDDVPIGSNDIATAIRQYNPQHPIVITEPWIWRRTWFLGDAALRGAYLAEKLTPTGRGRPLDSVWSFPPNNALYGSIQDGPHIDAKTRRRILEDERLWIATAARLTPMGSDFSSSTMASDMLVDIRADLRFFGALRRRRNRSAF